MKTAGTARALQQYVLLATLLILPEARCQETRKPFLIVKPVDGHSKLEVDRGGLEVLRSFTSHVAPVVVIGPYRSGKSFLLNQLLGVGCDEGFGVGHTRNTQTKGVWFWGEPVQVQGLDKPLALLYFDTEGFESTGRADAYDDRIFALSTLLSSVLVYNLPETIRESDLEKLSFATQLAEALYGDVEQGTSATFEAANMVWVIQRDFLEGKTPQQMLQDALKPVHNGNDDKGISQVNRVRQSLARIVANSTAVGLKQPHLERTRLCALPDSELKPEYVAQRDALTGLVHRLAKPKTVNGVVQTGAELAALIEKVVGALNDRDMPTGSSIVEYFNKELVTRCLELYISSLEQLPLPVEEGVLEGWAHNAAQRALAVLRHERFGADGSSEVAGLEASLKAQLQREYSTRQQANVLTSTRVCERLEMECEDGVERQQHVALPSMERFMAKTEACRQRFNQLCIGPAHAAMAERLQKMWLRELAHFRRDYNDRLFNGLVILSLADILLFRFVMRISAMETLGWLLFIFLQIYPKLYLSGGSMYDTRGWQLLAKTWELAVYNPLFDLMTIGPILLVVAVASCVYRCTARLKLPCGAPPEALCGWLPCLRRRFGTKQLQRGQSIRDLDV